MKKIWLLFLLVFVLTGCMNFEKTEDILIKTGKKLEETNFYSYETVGTMKSENVPNMNFNFTGEVLNQTQPRLIYHLIDMKLKDNDYIDEVYTNEKNWYYRISDKKEEGEWEKSEEKELPERYTGILELKEDEVLLIKNLLKVDDLNQLTKEKEDYVIETEIKDIEKIKSYIENTNLDEIREEYGEIISLKNTLKINKKTYELTEWLLVLNVGKPLEVEFTLKQENYKYQTDEELKIPEKVISESSVSENSIEAYSVLKKTADRLRQTNSLHYLLEMEVTGTMKELEEAYIMSENMQLRNPRYGYVYLEANGEILEMQHDDEYAYIYDKDDMWDWYPIGEMEDYPGELLVSEMDTIAEQLIMMEPVIKKLSLIEKDEFYIVSLKSNKHSEKIKKYIVERAKDELFNEFLKEGFVFEDYEEIYIIDKETFEIESLDMRLKIKEGYGLTDEFMEIFISLYDNDYDTLNEEHFYYFEKIS